MNPDFTRRDFVKTTVGAGVALGLVGTPLLGAATLDAHGLPTAPYGRKGFQVPRMIMGLGSRFCTITDPEESDRLLNRALDNGLFCWDTAAVYEDKKLGVVSEERLGRVLAKRRKEVFLSTKVSARESDEARRQIERSLKRLGVTQLDQLMIHDVRLADDVAAIRRKGGVADLVHEMKATGVTRHIGFTGHTSAASMKELVEAYDFDSVLCALNHWGTKKDPREEVVLPAAQAKGMAVFVMKAVRPREHDASLTPAELIRYALTLPQPTSVIIGIDSVKVLDANVALLRDFRPLPPADMKRIAQAWQRFHSETTPPWLHAGYCDGAWA